MRLPMPLMAPKPWAVDPEEARRLVGTWRYQQSPEAIYKSFTVSQGEDGRLYIREDERVGLLEDTGEWLQAELRSGEGAGEMVGAVRIRSRGEALAASYVQAGESKWGDDVIATLMRWELPNPLKWLESASSAAMSLAAPVQAEAAEVRLLEGSATRTPVELPVAVAAPQVLVGAAASLPAKEAGAEALGGVRPAVELLSLEWWEASRRGLSVLPLLGEAPIEADLVKSHAEVALPVDGVVVARPPPPPVQEDGRGEATPREAVPEAPRKREPVPHPVVPGMDEANLTVTVEIEPKRANASESGEAGVARLMSQPGGKILATMAQEGWKVDAVDTARGLYDISLPPVRYELPGGVVSIPAPRFRTTVRDSFIREGTYEERLEGDLVLQNGENIMTVELGFPFRTKFSISAAGWTRAKVGWEKGAVSVANYVEVGLQLPRVPGLAPILQYFVRSYGNESTLQCAQALAKGADRPPPEDSLPEWLASGLGAVAERWDSVLQAIPELPGDQPPPEGRRP